MENKYGLQKYLVHGCDYNPDQWFRTPEVIDEDIRLMKLSGVNSATVGIFSWSMLEPEEGKYNFAWLDNIMDKLYEAGIDVILATPSGARPAWMAQKYPEVLRVEESGIRNEYGVRHNHCLTSPVYRAKVREINTALARRYKDHPALKMWHISNEYSGECHCELCQAAFRNWLKDNYNNDLDLLNHKWWNGFWSHLVTDWEQISSPKARGENHSSALKLCWDRFVTDSHISFFENEIAPLRELTPDIPVTTNFMRMYDRINYQRFAKHIDIISWDNYPNWENVDNIYLAAETAFCHDMFRSMKDGKPFFMMESTPSLVNWRDVNKLPSPGLQGLAGIQAIAHGSDSVQYFQWRKGRGSHEKFHGAVVDHSGSENTRVFREVSKTGAALKKLAFTAGTRCESRIAILCDWENSRAVKHYNGYNNNKRDYFAECIKWYRPFWKRNIPVDVISADADFSKYKLIIAPYLYMFKDDTESKIEEFVRNGGDFVVTYLTGVVDRDDLCYLGGLPANSLKDVFGIVCEETDSIPEKIEAFAGFNGKTYHVDHICDIIHAKTATPLGVYESDFYAGEPSVTVNNYGKGKAYYVAFRNDGELAFDFCDKYIAENNISPVAGISAPDGVSLRKRADSIFVLNFSGEEQNIVLDREYTDVFDDKKISGNVKLPKNGYLVLK